MKRICRISIYDALDEVHVAYQVREYADYDHEQHDVVVTGGTEFKSVGEANPREWLMDALIGLIEDL